MKLCKAAELVAVPVPLCATCVLETAGALLAPLAVTTIMLVLVLCVFEDAEAEAEAGGVLLVAGVDADAGVDTDIDAEVDVDNSIVVEFVVVKQSAHFVDRV